MLLEIHPLIMPSLIGFAIWLISRIWPSKRL